jgi:hypothetical protein
MENVIYIEDKINEKKISKLLDGVLDEFLNGAYTKSCLDYNMQNYVMPKILDAVINGVEKFHVDISSKGINIYMVNPIPLKSINFTTTITRKGDIKTEVKGVEQEVMIEI